MRITCLGILFVCALTLAADAQVRLAEVAGTLTDESGAVLPGVLVTATHVDTGQKRSSTTEAGGAFLFTALPVGVYEIRAELQGFSPVVIPDYRIGIGESSVLTIKMKVATLEETVTVQAAAPLIDTTKSSLTGKINQAQVEELPVNGRNWLLSRRSPLA